MVLPDKIMYRTYAVKGVFQEELVYLSSSSLLLQSNFAVGPPHVKLSRTQTAQK